MSGILRNLSLIVTIFILASCGEKQRFNSVKSTEVFAQEYNPPFLDVLWVVDDRSPMFANRKSILEETKSFFSRLDTISASYIMAVSSGDMLFSKGKPKTFFNLDTFFLTKSTGSAQQRTESFGNTLLARPYNLSTGPENRGFEASLETLKKYFIPRPSVPLVMVFISDSDDRSVVPSGKDAVDYYAAEYLKLKDGNANLLKVYSINYIKIEAGVDRAQNRCATTTLADIDNIEKKSDGTPVFEDRFFRLAQKLGGQTANLCAPFSQIIDLNGLRLRELQTKFVLSKKADPKSIDVAVFKKNSDEKIAVPKWSFNPETNEVVFEVAPPEGTNIQITFLTY